MAKENRICELMHRIEFSTGRREYGGVESCVRREHWTSDEKESHVDYVGIEYFVIILWWWCDAGSLYA